MDLILTHVFNGIVLEEGSKEGFKEIRPICAYACKSNSYNNKSETAQHTGTAGTAGVFQVCVKLGETIVLPILHTRGIETESQRS